MPRSYRRLAGISTLALSAVLPTGSTGAVAPRQEARVSSTINLVGQSVSDGVAEDELSASGDVFADLFTRSVRVHMYVEVGSTPAEDGVFAELPTANADAGSALGSGGRGRIQVSELRIGWTPGPGVTIHLGLMDLTGYLDISRIANDENFFFLGTPFVNNPTIGFPDYVLGGTLEAQAPWTSNAELAVSISSSHGLADNPRRSYGELFDIAAPGKGAFLASRVTWAGDRWRGSAGGWWDSSNRGQGVSHEGSGSRGGIFGVAGWSSGVHAVSIRLGGANGSGQQFHSFVGLNYVWRWRDNGLGLGFATIGPADRQERIRHAEAFLRRRLFSAVFVTASIQWLSDFSVPGAIDSPPGAVIVGGIRLSASFGALR